MSATIGFLIIPTDEESGAGLKSFYEAWSGASFSQIPNTGQYKDTSGNVGLYIIPIDDCEDLECGKGIVSAFRVSDLEKAGESIISAGGSLISASGVPGPDFDNVLYEDPRGNLFIIYKG